jgi:hypothetical protein
VCQRIAPPSVTALLISARTGKLPYLLSLISFSSQYSLYPPHDHSSGSASVASVSEATTAVAEEVWWFFAFLTAKEDAAVEACLSLGLAQVSTAVGDLDIVLQCIGL